MPFPRYSNKEFVEYRDYEDDNYVRYAPRGESRCRSNEHVHRYITNRWFVGLQYKPYRKPEEWLGPFRTQSAAVKEFEAREAWGWLGDKSAA
jgi:hypothetical protein